MPSFRRRHIPGVPVFFTVALAERGSTLLTDRIDLLRASVQRTLRRRPFHIDAWVVLPDHMHCVWTLPDDDPSFSERWGTIKARFSREVRAAWRAGCPATPHCSRSDTPGLWQPRFRERHLQNAADYEAHLHYCRMDPVRHGLAPRPEDWPFSSVHRDRRMAACAA